MTSLLIAIAVSIVVAIVLVRGVRRYLIERRLPGRSAQTAIRIEDYSDIDVAVRMESCPCGGRFTVRGEGPTRRNERPLRVAYLECRACNRERRMYFDLTALRGH